MNSRIITITRLWAPRLIIMSFFILWGFMSVSFAKETKVDMNALMQDTQKMNQSADEITMIWWIPEEFWRASFEQDPNVTAAQTEEFIQVLLPYILIVAVDGKVGSFGGITYKSKSAIQGSIEVVDKDEVHYRPLSDDKVDADTRNFLSMMKPVFTNMLGQMGQNMNFILFSAKGNNGENIATPQKEGAFSVMLGKKKFDWRLPLGSLMAQKECPVDGKKLSGAWKFCPWHGAKL